MSAIPVIDQSFGRRLRQLERKHRRMRANGSRRRVGPDGLVVEYPRRALPRFPFRALLLLAVLAFGFKLWMFAALGAADYQARVDALAQGNLAQQSVAWLLQPEAVTETAAGWAMAALAALRG